MHKNSFVYSTPDLLVAFLPEESGCSLVEQCFVDHTLAFLLALIDEDKVLKGLGHHWLATVTPSM